MTKDELDKYDITLINGIIPEQHEILKSYLSELQLKIIANRIDLTKVSPDVVSNYIHNKIDISKNLNVLTDVFKAGELIVKHINKSDHIVVVTDCDSDGINSAVVLYRSLVNIFNVNKDLVHVIVNKRKYGNGVNSHLVEQILELNKKHDIKLMITADHGSANNHSYGILKEHIETIVVTDHHHIDYSDYPFNATVFVNNQRTDSYYSKDVSGCCIAFLTMLATYISAYKNSFNLVSIFKEVLPYVAISTITDVMSLAEPFNRHLVYTGFNELNSYRNPVWRGIKRALKIPGKITRTDIGFKIGPLINTANRMDVEELAFNMLNSETEEEAYNYACELMVYNTARKSYVKEFLSKFDKSKLNGLYGNVEYINTTMAIAGVIAPTIGSFNNRPTVCFVNHNNNNDILCGSGRSVVDGLDMNAVLTDVAKDDPDVFIKENGKPKYGGHEGAAGCTIHKDKFSVFKKLFNKHAEAHLKNIVLTSNTIIDAYIPESMLDIQLAYMIDLCGPYGKDWKQPVFATSLKVYKVIHIGNVVKILFIKKNGDVIDAMYYFNTVSDITVDNIRNTISNKEVIVVYTYELGTYNGVYGVNMNIIDIKVR